MTTVEDSQLLVGKQTRVGIQAAVEDIQVVVGGSRAAGLGDTAAWGNHWLQQGMGEDSQPSLHIAVYVRKLEMEGGRKQVGTKLHTINA